jgi:hypothetical protein
MNEELAWVQLDLDTVNHNVSSHGLIIPICNQIESWGIDKLLDKHVKVKQKVYDFTPNQKIVQVMASMMFGCEDNKRMNKCLERITQNTVATSVYPDGLTKALGFGVSGVSPMCINLRD